MKPGEQGATTTQRNQDDARVPDTTISLRDALERDAKRYIDFFSRKPLTARRFGRLLLTPEYRLVVAFRVYSWLHAQGWVWPAYLLYSMTKSRTACDLSPAARIGPGLRIEHRSDIVIGPAAVLGSDISVFNGVTIGKRRPRLLSDDLATQVLPLEMPTIADRVMIGAGAKLLGAITVGSDAIIGANAVVLHDVPCGATVVGVPARQIAISETRPDGDA